MPRILRGAGLPRAPRTRRAGPRQSARLPWGGGLGLHWRSSRQRQAVGALDQCAGGALQRAGQVGAGPHVGHPPGVGVDCGVGWCAHRRWAHGRGLLPGGTCHSEGGPPPNPWSASPQVRHQTQEWEMPSTQHHGWNSPVTSVQLYAHGRHPPRTAKCSSICPWGRARSPGLVSGLHPWLTRLCHHPSCVTRVHLQKSVLPRTQPTDASRRSKAPEGQALGNGEESGP